jgi:hypothetical protein
VYIKIGYDRFLYARIIPKSSLMEDTSKFSRVQFETSTASVCSEVFSGDQSSEDGVGNQRLGDCLCHSSHEPLMVEAEIVSET